jgi:hypothetical protein
MTTLRTAVLNTYHSRRQWFSLFHTLPSLHSTFKTIEESLRQDNQGYYATRNSTLTNNYDQIHQYFNRSRQTNNRTFEHTLSLTEIAKQDSLENEGEEMNMIHALQLGETDLSITDLKTTHSELSNL